MRRSISAPLVVVLVLVLGAGLWTPVSADEALEQEPAGEFVHGEILVELGAVADLETLLTDYPLALLSQFGTRPIYQLAISDGTAPPDMAAALTQAARVLQAEPNYLGQVPESIGKSSWFQGGGTGGYDGQWAAQRIRLAEAHAHTRGAGVTVAVLDTGIDPAHPLFQGRLTAPRDLVDDDADPSEVGAQHNAYGHGTHVAGLVVLAAPAAQIMPIRVLDPNGAGQVWVLLEGLRYAVNHGADVINLSLSFPRESTLLADIVEEISLGCDDDDGDDDDGDNNDGDDDDDDCGDVAAGNPGPACTDLCVGPKGVVVVAAAGNSGSSVPEYPAAEEVPGVLAVAATTRDDTLAAFSNYGPWVTLAAPGERILSSVPGGLYSTWSGTSMATPLVAGTAALVRAWDADLSAADVASRIVSHATFVGGSVPWRLDAAAALGLPAAQATPASATH